MPNLIPLTIETERLTLRWVDASDAPALFAIYSHPDVVRYWSRGPWTDMAQAEEMVAATRAAYADGSALRLGLVLRASGELIGNASLHHFEDTCRRCEIGYALQHAHWGHGYVTEALRALIDHGFQVFGLNRIEADVDPRNLASARALEKLGFRKEGYMPERWIVEGEPADTVWYGLLKRYWNTQ